MSAAALQFESGEYLYGYTIAESGNQVQVQIFSFPWQSSGEGLVYSVQIIDQASGATVASHDRPLKRNHVFSMFRNRFVKGLPE